MNSLNIILEIENEHFQELEVLYSFKNYINPMSCNSIAQLSLGCRTNKIAGVHRLYMIAVDDLVNLPGTGEVFSLDENGEIEAVGIRPGKEFVEIGALRGTVGLAEVLNKDFTKGISFFKNTINLSVSGLELEVQDFIHSVLNRPVVILIKTYQNNYIVSGLNGTLELTTLTGGSGQEENSLIGYALGFEGINNQLSPIVNPDIFIPIDNGGSNPENSPYITVNYTGDGIYNILAEHILEKVIVIPEGDINIKIGSTPDTDDILFEWAIAANTPAVFDLSTYTEVDKTIYISGITAFTKIKFKDISTI